MKLTIALAPAFLLLGSCSGERHAEAAKSNPPATQDKKAGEVRMDSLAQRNAGIAVTELRPQAVSESIAATGELTYNEEQTWTVGALLDGRITNVLVKAGDAVRQGQVLAQLHSHEVHDARAAFKKASADLGRYEAAASQARRMRDRAKRLLALKAASQQEVEVAESDVRSAETAVQNARTELEKERVHITEFLDVPLEDDAHNQPGHEDDFVPIKSPARGVVVEKKATAGTVVSSGDEVFRISNLSSLWMMASVNEADLQYLQVGQPVRVLVRAYPDRPFPGRILRLGEGLDPATRTLRVRVLVPNQGGLLKPEMYASAEVQRNKTREALVIPESAGQDLNGQRVVFVRTAPERFEPRLVEIRSLAGGNMEVVSGLRPGDLVVIKGSFLLKSELLKSSLQEE